LNRRSLLALAAAGLAGCAADPALAQPSACPGAANPTLKIESLEIVTSRRLVKLQVEVADTERTRTQGLMCRRAVPAGGGMLFDFKTSSPRAFWMRNTLIPLDMLFITEGGVVLNIARNTRPLSDEPVPSAGPVRAVLELAGGRAAEFGILPGDKVRHRIFPRG
jgi:uncharacterized protein